MSLEELINKNYEYLSDTDFSIAKYVLANKEKIGKSKGSQVIFLIAIKS